MKLEGSGLLGRLDDQGRLWFCGRKSHRIRAAGGDIPSGPVEGVYDEHPAVRWTALVGVGAPEVPVLLVELHPGRAWSPELEAELAELREKNINVNCVLPTVIDTPENRARGMGMIGAAFGLGFIFGPAIGG